MFPHELALSSISTKYLSNSEPLKTLTDINNDAGHKNRLDYIISHYGAPISGAPRSGRISVTSKNAAQIASSTPVALLQ